MKALKYILALTATLAAGAIMLSFNAPGGETFSNEGHPFDGKKLYKQSFALIRDRHLALADAARRADFVKEWEHKLDDSPLLKNEKSTDSEIEKMTADYVSSFEKEAMLLKEFNKQFLKVLPNKKVLMLYRTENEFRGYLIREYKRGQKKD